MVMHKAVPQIRPTPDPAKSRCASPLCAPRRAPCPVAYSDSLDIVDEIRHEVDVQVRDRPIMVLSLIDLRLCLWSTALLFTVLLALSCLIGLEGHTYIKLLDFPVSQSAPPISTFIKSTF